MIERYFVTDIFFGNETPFCQKFFHACQDPAMKEHKSIG